MPSESSSGLLSYKTLIGLAERDCGAYGATEPSLAARFIALIEWINARGPYTAEQLDGMRRQLVRLLSNRLRIALDRKRFPVIAQEKIERPIFVIGFARSGTTLLHSLLAEDPQVTAPRWWHGHVPSPPPGLVPVCAERMNLAQREIERLIDFVPGLLVLHPYWDKLAHTLIEDEELFTLDFRNAYPNHLYNVPTLEILVEVAGDPQGTYEFHRELLQHLQWNTGTRRWACKGVGHQFHLSTLLDVYPDAICVWPHRSPAETHVSMMAIASVLYDAIDGGRTDWHKQARIMAESMKAGLDHAMASPLIDDPRVIHLPFKEIVADPVAAVRKVYARADLHYSAEFDQRMRKWLADPANSADRYGRFPYSAAAFGLSDEWLKELFADYNRRFDL